MAHIPADKIQPQDMVEIWDLGPPEPESPKVPETAGLDPASVEHHAAHVKRNALVAEYQAKKDEWDEWKKNPGPRSMRMHVSDARQAMDKEPERYVLEVPEDKKAKPAAADAKHDESHPDAKPSLGAKPPEPKHPEPERKK